MIWEEIDSEELGTLTKKRLVRLLDIRYVDENTLDLPDWNTLELETCFHISIDKATL